MFEAIDNLAPFLFLASVAGAAYGAVKTIDRAKYGEPAGRWLVHTLLCAALATAWGYVIITRS